MEENDKSKALEKKIPISEINKQIEELSRRDVLE
ncbi:hypothetical protein HNR33_000094 [Brassicibacter mesophilus]